MSHRGKPKSYMIQIYFFFLILTLLTTSRWMKKTGQKLSKFLVHKLSCFKTSQYLELVETYTSTVGSFMSGHSCTQERHCHVQKDASTHLALFSVLIHQIFALLKRFLFKQNDNFNCFLATHTLTHCIMSAIERFWIGEIKIGAEYFVKKDIVRYAATYRNQDRVLSVLVNSFSSKDTCV